MSENFWFGISAIEFLVLIAIFVPKLLSRLEVTVEEGFFQKSLKGRERTGIIRNLTRAYKEIGNNPITVFEVHEPSGVVHYVGIDKHTSDLVDGITIEFWVSREIL